MRRETRKVGKRYKKADSLDKTDGEFRIRLCVRTQYRDTTKVSKLFSLFFDYLKILLLYYNVT